MTDYELTAWLGPAADELNAEQMERLTEQDQRIQEQYPDPDEQPERDAALSAVVQYLLGEVTAADVQRDLLVARQRERDAYVAALTVAVMMVGDRTPKATAARECGIDRMSLLAALGER